MKKRIITNQTINSFKNYLIENEKATATIEKYMRDIHLFVEYVADKLLTVLLLSIPLIPAPVLQSIALPALSWL